MDLHRNMRPAARWVVPLVISVVLVFSPRILAAMGVAFDLGDGVAYVLAGLVLITAVAEFSAFRRRFGVRIDEQGIAWDRDPSTVMFAWSDVAAVTIDEKTVPGPPRRPSLLTVWTPAESRYPVEPHLVRLGLNGYRLADLGDVAESLDEVVAVLRNHGGDRYLPAGVAGPQLPPGSTPPQDKPESAVLRPPVDGECMFCGGHPAAHVALLSVASLAIFHVVSNDTGWMCRSCGLALYRRHTNRSLLQGWWGVGLVSVPVLLLVNRVRMRPVLRLNPPQPTPGVAALVPVPLDIGPAVRTRPGGIVGLAVLAVLVLLVVVGLAGI